MLLNATSKQHYFITLVYFYSQHLRNSKINEIRLRQSTGSVHVCVKFGKAIWMQSDSTFIKEILCSTLTATSGTLLLFSVNNPVIKVVVANALLDALII